MIEQGATPGLLSRGRKKRCWLASSTLLAIRSGRPEVDPPFTLHFYKSKALCLLDHVVFAGFE